MINNLLSHKKDLFIVFGLISQSDYSALFVTFSSGHPVKEAAVKGELASQEDKKCEIFANFCLNLPIFGNADH